MQGVCVDSRGRRGSTGEGLGIQESYTKNKVDCHVDNKGVYTYDKEEDGDETIPWEPAENRSAITENEEVTIREVSEADQGYFQEALRS